MTPTLYVFSGLPGAGKTTLSQGLCRAIGAVYVRIDTIEQGLRDLCAYDVQGEGYGLAYRLAADNLRLGQDVVADSCNPISLTRQAWRDIATNTNARCVQIEVVCSDPEEHRKRIETRQSNIPGLALPSWQAVLQREFHAWESTRWQLDTAGCTPQESLAQLLALVETQPPGA